MIKRVRINNQITAPEMRVIGNNGENFGVLKTSEAIKLAMEQGLDLIEISPSAKPPVAKIMEYGKYRYKEQKKAQKTQTTETKTVQIGLTTSPHDLELKAKKIDEFFKEGNRARIDMTLRGREKYLDRNFIEDRLKRLLNLISENYKIADGPKKGPRGITIVVEKIKQ